ncbi:MAG: TIM-barrel domain-containing protein, partial [Bacteroidota bacterium]
MSRHPCVPHLVLLLASWALPSLAQPNNPAANPEAIVVSDHARFTILTPQLLRMEWSEDAKFEDNASLVFVNRMLPVPRFTSERKNGWLLVQTDKLTLKYKEGSGKFRSDNLDVVLAGTRGSIIWRPGMKDTANLGGTIRTLDGVEKPVPLEPGILSRDGWTVADDSERPLFDGSEWPWVVSRPTCDRQDFYFFGYGRDYKKALHDFTRVAGMIPMPPRFAFGLWWSRYWAYTDQELKELVHEFETHDVPLDVLVIDMDWHQTFNLRWDTDKRDQAGQRLGWTGYTWDRTYFPDPPAFLAWCESRKLKTPLNIHPASGI